ncbi:hypothetical protein [Cupriavidus oxalaticus]|uniref:Lipoprotein n=1 Tax=Cupriavidus oxalaticus TaxID=96344 RepID=A0A4P7LLJ1_9BURK|nr:hypothetical protein [Cupriavidus oxalaticus]QBY54453.1 hypothetical protein E0W60_26020 [Cupriavidus oxalaticus]
MTLGVVAGAILGALAGGAAGCSTGSAVGELIDDKILDNYRCLDCAHTFAQAKNTPYAGSRQPSDDSDANLFDDPGYAPFHAD